jgi:hypothetical protein
MVSKFLKYIKYSALAFVGFILVALIYDAYEDELEFAYTKAFFEVPTVIRGVAYGDSKSDVFFRLGEPEADCSFCDEREMLWIIGDELLGDYIYVGFENDLVISVWTTSIRGVFGNDYALKNTEQLLEILGEPDILAITPSLFGRRYTYLDWGVTFSYEQNELIGVLIGKVEWREAGGEYFVRGKQICPGDDCPWDESGALKLGYEDKTYRDFF